VKIIFSIDGSPDDSEQSIRLAAMNYNIPVHMLRLSRNFGVGPALHAGLEASDACATVVFGSDLQEPLDLFVKFVNKICSEGVDVCLGQRMTRSDPARMKFFSAIFWWINRHFLENDTPKGGFDVFGVSQRARLALVSMRELNSSITSQLQWVGFNREYIRYDRTQRIAGKSTWSFRKKLRLFADSIYGFSGLPIAILTSIGLLSVCVIGLISVMTLVGAILGIINVKGYATILLLIAFGNAVTISGVGILGGYIFRTFDNSKGRPKFIVQDDYRLNQGLEVRTEDVNRFKPEDEQE